MQKRLLECRYHTLELIRGQERTLDSVQLSIDTLRNEHADQNLIGKLRRTKDNLLACFSMLSGEEAEAYVHSTSERDLWRRYGVSTRPWYGFVEFFSPILPLSFFDFSIFPSSSQPHERRTDVQKTINEILKSLERRT